MKYNWNSTRKTKKETFLGFILQDITLWNHKNARNCYFVGVLWEPGNQCGIQWFFMILWISESFSLYLLVKNSFDFKLVFFTYFEYTLWVIIKKTFYIQITIVPGDIDPKKTRKTSHKIFSQCLIVNSSFLWAFMFQNVCKNSFSAGKSRKHGIPVIKIIFSL